MNTAAWRASLRLGRRDVRRSRGRSLLVVVMVGLPVAATTMLTSMVATADVTPVEAIPATMGTSQALIQPEGRDPVDQTPTGDNYDARGNGSDRPSLPWTPAEVQQLTGGHVATVLSGSTIRVSHGRLTSLPVREVDLRDEAAHGMVDLLSGRVPARVGEVTVSPEMARSGIHAGDRIALAQGHVTATVVGVARPRFGDDSPTLQAFPGTLLTADSSQTSFLVDRSAPITWSDVRRLDDRGLVTTSRQVLADPPPRSEVAASMRSMDTGLSSEEAGVLTIVIASIVIEVVLLAGPAFAVGVARQRRQLALVAAIGGHARDVRRIVLAQGMVLGVGSAALGVVVGVGAARIGVGPLRRVGANVGPWDVVPWQVLSAFALGAVASVAAAWFPARQAARQDVVAVLAGRRGVVRTRRGWPVAGLALVVLGTLGALSSASRPNGETTAAFCTVVVVLGMVALMPAILGLVGRVAGGLPLPLRLAARDASRQRGRTAPAVAAVMGAVAGITALALGSSSDFAQSRRDYEPQYAAGTTVVQAGGMDQAAFTRLQDDTRRLFDGRELLPYSSVDTTYDDQGHPTSKGPSQLVVQKAGCAAPAVGADPQEDPDCDSYADFSSLSTVASADVVRELGTRLSADAASALDSGKVVVGDRRLLDADGRVRLTLVSTDDDGKVTEIRTLPPVPGALRTVQGGQYSSARGSAVTMAPATAERLHLPLNLNGGVLSSGTTLSRADESRLAAVVPTPDADQAVYTERGFQETYTVQLIALGLAGLVTVLVGTLTAVGLALSDARPDLATLAAVGARPRTRRTMAAAQALVIGLLGTVTGVLVGFVPGWAVSRPLTDSAGTGPIFDVPWLLLGGVGVGVPVLAALGALVMVRSRLPLTRRTG